MVRAEMGETDLTKREELVQPLKIFRARNGTSFVPYQRGEFRNYPPVPCTDEEFYTILDQWITDGIIKTLEARPDLTDEDKKNP